MEKSQIRLADTILAGEWRSWYGHEKNVPKEKREKKAARQQQCEVTM